MITSDPRAPVTEVAAPVSSVSPETSVAHASPADLGGFSFAGELARLANQALSQMPGAVASPHIGPSATDVGAGGVSSALTLPPFPGFVHQPPIASAPPPKESDVRTVPAIFSESLGFSSPLVFAGAYPAAEATPSAAPLYFLTIAGMPGGADAAPAPPSLSGMPAPAAPAAAAPAPAAPVSLGSIPAASAVPQSPPVRGDLFDPEMVPDLGSSRETSRGASSGASRGASPGASRGASSGASSGASRGIFDAASIKRDFPILSERVHGQPLIWLDNAATTQKPRSVIDRLSYFYEHENSNIHRAAHALAARATDAYEAARDKVRRFLNAPSPREIIFARGATEAINLVAQSWGRRNIQAGDQIVITWLEHHANIVPWQQLCAEKGARLCVAPVDARGQVILEEYEKLLNPRTRLVSFTQVSNALGTILPAREMVAMAHRHGAVVMVDGAQAVSHMPVDVQALDCDFYCFSGHKVFAPTGIGVLYGKAEVLERMPPWQGGGNMISDVTFEKTAYQPPPGRFEAGTGNIADAVGLGAAIDYVSAIGMETIARYEHELLEYATGALARVPGLQMIGTAPDKAGVLSFVLDGMRTEDVGAALDREGIAVRSGHHCAQPILRRFGLESTVRASLAPYNTPADIDALCAALLRLQVGRPARGL
jgi:cysteine desulfurase/selenocysteine lyase